MSLAQGILNRNACMDAVERGASEDEKVVLDEAIILAARALPFFTSDDVWDRTNISFREKRVLGPLMDGAKKRRVMIAVPGCHVQSRYETRNAGMVQLWRSLISEVFVASIICPCCKGSGRVGDVT